MDELPELGLLMTEIGPWVDAAQVVQHEEGLWSIVLDEDLVIVVEHDGDRDMLVLTVSLGTPPPEDEAIMHSMLLQTNALWRDTGAIRMGLDSPGGEVVLMADVPLKGLDVDGLGYRLHRYTEAALGWREVISKTADSFEPDSKALAEMLKI
jgi:hypothetical protein